ncbi:tyrosine-type recombinase/integrase [Bizionia sediminis]|uniref:Tyrosine-type recombinase/integrase n=1 Tax=Bizionia sediminis TaxID=1737064 RepID=A0ABW5KU77_9FLAO
MKTSITLKPLQHKNKAQIAIGFTYNHAVKTYVKGFKGVLWSRTHSTFYVAFAPHALHALFEYLRKGRYYVDYSAFIKKKPETVKPPAKTKMYNALSLQHKNILKQYVLHLKGRRLSAATVNTYSYFVLRFLFEFKTLQIEGWRTKHIHTFMSKVMAKENYSISSHRQCVSAFKYLTSLLDLPDFDASDFKRPKKDKKLPTVVSKEAVIRLIQVTKNLKHRVAIALLYSCGLRVGELLALKPSDLNFERQQVFIRRGKGRKDRMVGMATTIQPMLLNYINTYQPQAYLIEGRDGAMYSASSVRRFLKDACKLAGIAPAISPHALRHSYATHMLENGVDLRYIQTLLGHSKPETTMVYTHVAKSQLMRISNPLDVTVNAIRSTKKDAKKVTISRQFNK